MAIATFINLNIENCLLKIYDLHTPANSLALAPPLKEGNSIHASEVPKRVFD